MRLRSVWLLNLLAAALVTWGGAAEAITPVKSICRVKGQEENTLHGLGVVMGLSGTGDGANFLPTIRSLATAMELMGSPIGPGGVKEIKDAKNVALVMVTATIPAAGARQGDKIDCVVSSVGSAKSLAGGRLFFTPLLGPDPQSRRVFALAQGAITIDDGNQTTGRVHGGCRLEEDFFNLFAKDGKVTLVLDENHADFQVAQDIAELINSETSLQSGGVALAKALDQVNIEVQVPQQYRDHLVEFVSQIMELPMLDPQTAPRVVINERTGSIVIGGDVEIGPVVVTHKNVLIEAGQGAPAAGGFVAVDPSQPENPKLKALVANLNALQVPKEDIVDIIKGLAKNGKLYARLVVE